MIRVIWAKIRFLWSHLTILLGAGVLVLCIGLENVVAQRSFTYGLTQKVQSGALFGGCIIQSLEKRTQSGPKEHERRACVHVQSTQLYNVPGLYYHQLHAGVRLSNGWLLSTHLESFGVDGLSQMSGQIGLLRTEKTVDLWVGPWIEHNPYSLHRKESVGSDLWTQIRISELLHAHLYLSSQVWPTIASGFDIWIEFRPLVNSTLSVGHSWMTLWGTRNSMLWTSQLHKMMRIHVGVMAISPNVIDDLFWTQSAGILIQHRSIGLGFQAERHPVLGWSLGAIIQWLPRD